MLVHKGGKENIPNSKFKNVYKALSRPPFIYPLCPPTIAITVTPYFIDGILRHKTIKLIDSGLTGHQKGMQSSSLHVLAPNTVSSSVSTNENIYLFLRTSLKELYLST